MALTSLNYTLNYNKIPAQMNIYVSVYVSVINNTFFQKEQCKGLKSDIKMLVLLLVEKIVLLFNTNLLIKPSFLIFNQIKIPVR